MDTTTEIGIRTVISAVLAVVATLMMAASVSTLARTSISGDASSQMFAQQHDATHLVV